MAPPDDPGSTAGEGRIARRTRRGRALRVGLVALVLVVAVLAAGLAWLSSESAARVLVAQAVAASGGRLSIEPPSGTLTGVLRVPRIVWHDATTTVAVDEAAVGLDPRALLFGRLRLRELTAARVEVVTEPSDSPAAPPASLALPFGLELPDARIGKLVVRRAGSDEVLGLTDLRASARYAAPRWTLDTLSLSGPFGHVTAGGTVTDAPPFTVAARALLETRALDEAIAIDATAQGPLDALALEARTVLRDASLIARTTIAPFAAQPIGAVDASFANADLSRFAEGLPATRLGGRLQAEPRPGAAPSGALPPASGTLAVRNERPGRLDAGLLPLASAELRFEFDGERLRLPELALAGPPGRLAGDAMLALPGGALPAAGVVPAFELALSTGSFDLSRVHATLRPTALRGNVRVAPERGGLAAEGRLADGELSLDARVRWAGTLLTVERARLQARDGIAELAGSAGTASPHRFEFAGTIAGLDPSRFAEAPAGSLNGRWQARGSVAPRPVVDAAVTLTESRLRGQALSGAAAAAWTPGRVERVAASLRYGSTAFSARGALGAPGDRLAITADASRLQELDPKLAGRASLDAELRDALLAPGVSATLRGRDLATKELGAVRAAQLSIDVPRPAPLGELLLRLGVPGAETLRRAGGVGSGTAQAGDAAKDRAAAAATGAADARTATSASSAADARAAATARGTEAARRATAPTAGAKVPGVPDAPIKVALQADGLRAGGVALDTLRVDLSGDADRHVLAARAFAPKRDGIPVPVDAALRIEGGLERGAVRRWRGRLLDASNATAPTLRLLAPVELAASPDAASAGPLKLELDGPTGGRLELDEATWREGRVRLKGGLAGVPLRWLGPLAEGRGMRLDDPGALRVGARIDVSGSPASLGEARGRIEVFRESGDLLLDVPAPGGGSELLRAGLQALDVRATLADGRIAASATVRGDAIGTLRADARAPLTWRADGRPDLDAPLSGEAELAVPSLAFGRALAGEAWRFDGALDARLALSGTLAAPAVTGRIEGRRLAAEQRELGMRLSDGELRATLRDRAIEIETLRFSSGKGTVSMTGSLRADERSEAVLVLDRMPIPLGAGQRLSLSGEARATLRDGVLRLRGGLRADEGVIELTAGDAPRVSKDVIVVRDAAEASAVAAARAAARRGAALAGPPDTDAESGQGFRILSDLQIDLGDRFRVFGAGVDARLEGVLTLRGRVADALRLTGTVRVVQGTYTGFGQRLQIERGTLVFSGPVDNPAIDVVAFRRYLPVEAGVAVTGTAKAPRVALVSRPDVPDPEKLSWLVLGTGSDTSRSGQQSAALSAAAATLLASADPGARPVGLASTFGLDVLSVRTGQIGSTGESGSAATSAQDSIVTLGKRITDRLFISYEQTLRGLTNLVRLQYEISERLSVRIKAGTENAVDLLWTVRYD